MSNEQQGGDQSIFIGANAENSIVMSGDGNTVNKTEVINILANEVKTRKLNTRSPYKGLEPFKSEDTDRFFGRDQFLAGLVEELDQTNFVLLLGASGSGKSSVVQAGLIPRLQERVNQFDSLRFTPDKNPFESLYRSLKNYKQSEAEIAKIVDADTLTQVVKQLKPPKSFWLIFIDQFEELFTLSGAGARDRFINSLVKLSQELAADPLVKVKIVATMRSDFLDRLDSFPANQLANLTEQHRPLITQMQPDELRLAIEQPAAHHGVVFEPGLVEEIIKEVQGQAGYLPVLQYTLNLLWEIEVKDEGINDRTLNTSSYRQIGGVRGALQQRVEQMYQSLSSDEQLAVQRIFLKLVEIGNAEATGAEWKPVRRRANRAEFTDQTEQAVLTQLIDAKLLVSDAPSAELSKKRPFAVGATVEIAHEILLTSWTTLNTWIEKDRQAIALRNRLNDDAVLWQVKKATSDLWSGSRLAQALELRHDPVFQEALGSFTAVADDFINASVGLRDRQRRRTILGLSGFSLVALILAAFAGYQWREAELGQIQALSASAESLLALSRPVDALNEATKVVSLLNRKFLFPEESARLRIFADMNQLIYGLRERKSIKEYTDAITGISFSSDGKSIAISSNDGTIEIRGLKGELIQTLSKNNPENSGLDLHFGKDDVLISARKDKSVEIWALNSNGNIPKSFVNNDPKPDLEDQIVSIALSPDNKVVAFGAKNGRINLWKENGEFIGFLGRHQDKITDLSFSPDGHTLASAGADQVVKLWKVESRTLAGALSDNSAVSEVSFIDNQTIVSGNLDGMIKVWDLRTKKSRNLGEFGERHSSNITSLAINQKYKILASASGDKTIKIWNIQDIQHPELLETLEGHEQSVSQVSFSPDGKTLVSGDAGGTVKIWTVISPVIIDGRTFSFSPDSQMIVTGDEDGKVKLWSINGTQVEPIADHASKILGVSFSPDYKTIVSVSKEEVKTWSRVGKPSESFSVTNAAKKISISISPDSKFLAMASREEKEVKIWELDTLKPVAPLKTDKPITSIAFSPDGKIIAAANRDQINLWDWSDRKALQPLKAKQSIQSISFSPDGKTIAASGSLVEVWSLNRNYQHQDFNDFSDSNQSISHITFSSNGQVLALARGDQIGILNLLKYDSYLRILNQPKISVLIHNMDSRQLPSKTDSRVYENWIQQVGFSQDGKLLATANDKNIVLWNSNPGKLLESAHSLHQ